MPRTTAIRKPKPAPTTAATITLPDLAKGETYAGILLQDGRPAHHLVLLPGDTSVKWKDAIAWAKKQGGELPTRKEQALLFANAADKFESAWYWSSEEYAGDADYAWIQTFNGNDLKSNEYRARAVRRVPI